MVLKPGATSMHEPSGRGALSNLSAARQYNNVERDLTLSEPDRQAPARRLRWRWHTLVPVLMILETTCPDAMDTPVRNGTHAEVATRTRT